MLLLTIRTDKPEAEIGIYKDGEQVAYEVWPAHRELAETVHIKIKEILNKSSIDLKDIGGIVVYQGPGSFTGLRIGLSVANALAYALQIPVVGSTNDDWIEQGIKKLGSNGNDRTVMPLYGAPAHVTHSRK